jgi:hypothetical protein
MAHPDGLMDSQYIHLRNSINNWCDAVRSKQVHRDEAWYCLNRTIMNTIEYCLVATSLSHAQVDNLMRPIFKLALNLCGLQKNFPRTLLYGSPAARGLGMKDPYWLQLVVHLTSIMKHQHLDTPSRDLHRENMELVQTYVGTDQNFWDLPFELFGHLAPAGWMKQTWEALSATNLSFRGPRLACPLAWPQDKFLMDVFLDTPSIPEAHLPILQEVRLHLRTDLLSDIVDASGSRITHASWIGLPHTCRLHPNWITTRPPTPHQLEVWQGALCSAFLIPPCSTPPST